MLVGAALVIVVAAFALAPLFRSPRPRGMLETLAAVSDPVSEARAERFRLYRQILDLELDLRTGKLATEDFNQIRGELLAQAALVLDSAGATVGNVDSALEQEIAEARRALSSRRKPAPQAANR